MSAFLYKGAYLEYRDNNAKEQGEPAAQRSERWIVWEISLPIHSLRLHALDNKPISTTTYLDKPNMCNQDGNPYQQSEYSHKIDARMLQMAMRVIQVFENGSTACRDVHVREATKYGTYSKGNNRYPSLIGPSNEFWSWTDNRQAIQRPRCDVEIRVGRRNNKQQNTGIQKTRQNCVG